jgi:hypothetical protein
MNWFDGEIGVVIRFVLGSTPPVMRFAIPAGRMPLVWIRSVKTNDFDTNTRGLCVETSKSSKEP